MKNSPLVIFKILGLFVNTLNADNKDSLLNRDNLTQPIQMKLFEKQKFFLLFFSSLLEFRLRLEHFEKKMTLRAYVFQQLQTVEDIVTQMSKKSRFKGHFNKRHGKRSQRRFNPED